jgi:hypothetical protein
VLSAANDLSRQMESLNSEMHSYLAGVRAA